MTDIIDPFAQGSAPSAPSAPGSIVDPFDSSAARAPAPTQQADGGGVKGFLKRQLGGQGTQDYGQGAGYLIDNPVTRGLGSAANTLATGAAEIAQRAVKPFSDSGAAWLQRNVTQPLAERGQQLDVPQNASLGAAAVQRAAELGGQLDFAGLTDGGSMEAEAPMLGASVLKRVASHITPGSLRAAAVLGSTNAGAEAAQQEAAGQAPESNLALLGQAAMQTGANLVPLGGRGSWLRRATRGALVSEGLNEAQNVVNGQPFGTGSVMATATGAGFGLLPHGPSVPHPGAEPGSLSDAANTLSTETPTLKRAPIVDAEPTAAPAETPPATTNASQPDQSQVAAPVTPPWVNPETGEQGPYTRADLRTALAQQMQAQYDAAGHVRIDPQSLSQAWGVPQSEILQERKRAAELLMQQRAAQLDAANQQAARAQDAADAASTAAASPTGEPAAEPASNSSEQPVPPASAANDAGATSASVPFMITNRMRGELADLGYGTDDISRMTPAQAHDILQMGEPSPGQLRDMLTPQAAASDAVGSEQPTDRTQTPSNATETPHGDDNSGSAPAAATATPGAEAGGAGDAQPAAQPQAGSGSGNTQQPAARGGSAVARPVESADANSPLSSAAQPKQLTAAVEQTPHEKVEQAAAQAALSPHNDLPEPTQAQKDAGNYQKGHVSLHGLNISIENPRGSVRSGTREDGSTWSHEMSDHYGYIKRTEGADGEHVDTYIGPKPESKKVYVVDQLDQKTGGFDEHKAMLGYTSKKDAIAAYKSNFDDGWKVGPVHTMDIAAFKDWLKNGDTTAPVAEHKALATVGAESNGQIGAKIPPEPQFSRPPYEMTTDEVHAHSEAVSRYGRDVEQAVLGDQADAWRKALRERDSSNDDVSNRGQAALDAIESKLSKRDVDALYGIGHSDEAFDELHDYREAHSDASVSSPDDAAWALGRFLSKLGRTEGKDPSQWKREEQVAYAGMREVGHRIAEEGWDSKAIQKKALLQAASKFRDPNDAAFILDRFLNLHDAKSASPAFAADGNNRQKALPAEASAAADRFDRAGFDEAGIFGRAIDDRRSVLESIKEARGNAAFKKLFDLVGTLEKGKVTKGYAPKLQEIADGLSRGFSIARTRVELHDSTHPEFGKMLGVYDSNNHVISLRADKLRSHEAVSTFFHEYGHHIVDQMLGKDLEHSEAGEAMYRAYMEWRREIAPDATLGEAKASRQAFFRNLYGDRTGENTRGAAGAELRDVEANKRDYALDPHEFFADMLARTLYDHAGAQRLLGEAGGIFAKIAQAMKLAFDMLRRFDGRLTDSPKAFHDFVDAAWNRYGGADEHEAQRRARQIAHPNDLRFSRDGWDDSFPDVVTAHRPGVLSEHPDYAAAKAGDAKAALRVARDIVTPDFVQQVRDALPAGSKPEIVPVVAREETGNNQIPRMAAEVLAKQLGTKVSDTIGQADKVGRGSSDAMDRLARQPTFTGEVKRGQAYVLLDDTVTQGGTLAQLKTHIEREGGRVVLATALTGKDYSRKLALTPKTLEQVRGRFGSIENWWREQFGHGFDGLTESEARTLLTYDKGRLSPDALRDSVLARRIEGSGGVGEGAAGDRPNPETPGAGGQLKPDMDDSGDPDKPDRPRRPFSHASQSIEQIHAQLPKLDQGTLQHVKDWISGKATDLEPKALGALQLRHVLELAGEEKVLSKPTKAYGELFQRMDAERNQMTTDGSAKVDALRKWAYERGAAGWLGKVKPEAQQLFRFMHDVTQMGVDPMDEYQRLLIPDARGQLTPWTTELREERIKALQGQIRGRGGEANAELREQIKYLRSLPAREKARAQKYPEMLARWNALTPEAREQFKVMRDHYRDVSDQLFKAAVERINSLDIPQQNKRAMIERMRQQFEDGRMDGVYFPLQRFGDYWIAGFHNGDYFFTKYESAQQAAHAEKALKAAGAEIEATGRQNNDYRAKNAPSGTFIGEIMDTLRKNGAPEKVQDEIYQSFLKTLPELSLRKSGIHRKNIAGYTDDVPRVFASNVFHAASQISKARYGYQLQNTMEHMKGLMDARRTYMDVKEAAHADALLGELQRRNDWILNPTDSKLANVASSIGFAYHLAASPASALVNLIQTPHIVLPVLGARHGWAPAMRELSAAMRDAVKTGGNIQRTLRTDDERQAYRALQQQGTIQRTATHNLAGLAEGNALKSNPAYAKVMNAVSWMFHTSEMINRESTAIAAYRLARAQGQSFHDAVKYADEITNGTHGDYSNANRARYMQGNVGKILFQFKNYSLAMSWLWGRNFYKAFKGETPEVQKLARRTLTGMLGMTGLFAGVVGMPIFNALRYSANAVHLVTGDPDEPWDFETEFRSWLAEHLGSEAANVIADGAANQVTGADVASRVSMSDLWFRDVDKQLTGESAYDNMLESIAGPLGGMIKNMYVGTQLFNEGHTERGIETMLPAAAANALKAMRYETQGANSLKGDPIVPDVSTPQALIQAIGFTPTVIAEQRRVNNALENYQSEIQTRRATLMNAFALAKLAGDDDGAASALEQIQAFNQKYPEVAISMNAMHDSLRRRAENSARAENGINLNRKLAQNLKEQVGVQ
jgi:hypothetical protein